jgi:hypothetical protein
VGAQATPPEQRPGRGVPIGTLLRTRSCTMPSPSTDPEVLRARARALRSLASRVDESVLGELVGAGGDDTWRGPTAFAFQTDARRADRWREDAVASLRRAARQLEATAADLDRQRLR